MLTNLQPMFHFCTPLKITDVFMGYRIGTLAGNRLRKSDTHNSFAILKVSLIHGLKQMLPD